MAVPPQGELYRPLLEIAADIGDILSKTQFRDELTVRFSLTENDLAERIPSGSSRLEKNIAYCVWHLEKAELLHKPTRGRFQITVAGREFLTTHDSKITSAMLNELIEQRETSNCGGTSILGDDKDVPQLSDDTNPEDKIENGYRTLRAKLVDDVLDRITHMPSAGFELLVVNLLEKMGYGKGQAVGRSGDGGIDGIIDQDALGLEKVYIQAKRWQSQVGDPEIRNFSGSLDAKGASKGVFVTTSTFSTTATQTAKTISAGSKFIRLIDGPELARLMLDHDVGVITTYTYKIQALDENYFSEEL